MLGTPTLGVGANSAVVYQRGGTRPLFDVPAVSSLEWNRTLDAVSRSTITTSASRAGSATWVRCCEELSQIQPWAHEVVMFRNGERVWEGPVRRVVQNRSGVQVYASDVTGWAERRVQTVPVLDTLQRTSHAANILDAVFLGVVDNVLPYVQQGGTASGAVLLDVKAGGYWAATLAAVVSAGLSWTTVGRRIIIWDDPSWTPGVTPILNPQRHLLGDVETAREGDDLAVDAYAANDNDEVGSVMGDHAYYGAVQRVFSASGVTGLASLNDAASRWQGLRYPMPESLTIPADSTLHCEAPFPIGILVPGVTTPVKVTDLCWPVEQPMTLTALRVTQDQGGEKVGVTYAPITSTDRVVDA